MKGLELLNIAQHYRGIRMSEETTVRYRVLRELKDWMTAKQIAAFLQRDSDAVKGVLTKEAINCNIEEKHGNGEKLYRSKRNGARQIISGLWVDTQWIHELEKMRRGYVL